MELLFALVVIGGMIVGIVAMYNKNQNTANAKQVANDVQTLASGIKTLYASSTTGFTNLKNLQVVQAGIVPKTLVSKDDGTILNKYNGNITIQNDTKNSDYSASFSITEDKLPPEVVSKAIGQIGTEGILGISVNDKACIYSSGTTGADLAKTCDATKAIPYNVVGLTAALNKTNDNKFTIVYAQ